MKRLLVTLLLITTLVAQYCHYSCSTCLDLHYSHCTACVPNTATISSQGFCTPPPSSSLNGFGLFLLLLVIGAGLFLRSQHIFYFILSLQVFGLLGLMEVAFSDSLTTILDAFQYLMIFSKMQRSNKMTDNILVNRSMYRLESFLVTVSIKTNLTPAFVIVFLIALCLGIVLAIRKFRNGRCMLLSDSTLDTILTALRTIILLTMQEMLLICYTGIRFDSVGASEVILVLLYCIVLVFLLVDINYHRVPFFKSKKLLNLAIAQRLILPVIAVLPYPDTYQLVILFIAFAIIELVFLAKSAGKTKHYIYSFIRLSCCILMGVYVAVELGANKGSSSSIASVFATIAFSAFLVAFAVQICLSTKDRCMGGSKVQNREEGQLARANTNEKIAVLREDTINDNTIDGNPLNNSPREETRGDLPLNLLVQSKKKEKKFRAHKQ